MARSDDFLRLFFELLNPGSLREPDVIRTVRERWREAGLNDQPMEGEESFQQIEILAGTLRELVITSQSLMFLQRRRVEQVPFQFRVAPEEAAPLPEVSDEDATQIRRLALMVSRLDEFVIASREGEDNDYR